MHSFLPLSFCAGETVEKLGKAAPMEATGGDKIGVLITSLCAAVLFACFILDIPTYVNQVRGIYEILRDLVHTEEDETRLIEKSNRIEARKVAGYTSDWQNTSV